MSRRTTREPGPPEVGGPGVSRVDRGGRHPRPLRAHLRRAGLQDPHGLHGEQPPHRRPPAREQAGLLAVLRPPRGRPARQEAHRARPRGGVQVPATSPSATSSSGSSACPARRSRSATRRSSSTASRSTSPTSTSWTRHAPAATTPVGFASRTIGTTGVRRWCPPAHLLVLGRQPRQQPRRPFLGLPARGPGQGSCPHRLLVVRGHAGGVPSDRRSGTGSRTPCPLSAARAGRGSST